MDHTAVVREKMTERYLLNELEPGVRDEFEEHYFDCPDCAQDISAAAQFVAHTKTVLAEKREPSPVRAKPATRAVGRSWFAWLRPAFAGPVLALLLAVVGYQNLVTYPRLHSELNRPQVLPAVSVNVGTWGGSGTPTDVSAGKGLLLFLRIPPNSAYVRYTADLHDPAGDLKGSFAITPATGEDQWPVLVPGIQRQAGTYSLKVHGITPNGENKDVGNSSFELEIQK